VGIGNPLFRKLIDFASRLNLYGSRVMTVGRQSILIDKVFFSRYTGLDLSCIGSEYCEVFFNKLGLQVQSIDISGREGATYTANFAVNNYWRFKELEIFEGYDIVLDGGSTEHIINPITSVWNSYMLAKDGGYVYLHLPVSGWQNHGLYRFTPSFFKSISNRYLNLISLEFAEQLPQSPANLFQSFREGQELREDLQLMSHAIYRKSSGLSFIDFTEGTLQDTYR
jgi:hypothetical protein